MSSEIPPDSVATSAAASMGFAIFGNLVKLSDAHEVLATISFVVSICAGCLGIFTQIKKIRNERRRRR